MVGSSMGGITGFMPAASHVMVSAFEEARRFCVFVWSPGVS